MLPQIRKNKKGLTLVEIIVVLAIMTIVMATAYAMMSFSRRTLLNSNTHFDIQNDIRLTSSYITKAVRFATDLQLIPVSDAMTDISVADADNSYSYFYIDNGVLHHAKLTSPGVYEAVSYAEYINTTDSFFTPLDNQTLTVTLAADKDDKQYMVSTDIVLENFLLTNPAKNIAGTGPTLALKYRTEQPQITLIPVESIAISGSNSITVDDGTTELTAVVAPENASIKSLTWHTSNVSIASVNSAGIVTAKANGTVNITAKSTDGSNITSNSHQITISNQIANPTGIQLNTTPVPPSGFVGTAYSHTFTATGAASYTFVVEAGDTLPLGLTLNAVTGVVSGIPALIGTYDFTIGVVNSADATDFDTHDFSINILSSSVNVTVTFDKNKNSSTNPVPATLTVPTGLPYGALPNISDTSPNPKTFLGWWTAKNGGVQVTNTTLVTNNSAHTLYAHWTN